MSIRDDIQAEALAIAYKIRRGTSAISMGVGKTLIGLKYIDNFRKDNLNLRVLVVAPKLSIFQSWKDDGIKFGISGANIEFTTYLSLNKLNPHDYDIVVLDECHSLLNSHAIFLSLFNGRILGLTGTPPRHANSEKGMLIRVYCPVIYKYSTDLAIDNNILNNYKIIVHRLKLSSKNTIKVTLKEKEFYTSEVKNYNYWSDRVQDAVGMKQKQITSIMRMKALMEFQTKEDYAKNLFDEIEDKCLIFCNTQAQAERICPDAIHSNNPDGKDILEDLKNGTINKASCVLQISEGINIPELRAGIIMHSYGNERKSSQRIGRLLRLNPTETAIIHILCYKDTVDETWVEEALKDLDQSKIKYFDI